MQILTKHLSVPSKIGKVQYSKRAFLGKVQYSKRAFLITWLSLSHGGLKHGKDEQSL
jgi:hypothetical protein